MRGRGKGELREMPVPGWVEGFLDALGRTGCVKSAAAVAGVDVTGVYRRRRREAGFAAAWAEVLAARDARAGTVVRVDLPLPPAPSPEGEGEMAETPSPEGAGEKVGETAFGPMLRATGRARWGVRAREAFLIELTISANVRRAARAAGFSFESAYRRRRQDGSFAEAWDAAIDVGQARVRALLIEAAGVRFDPESLPVGTVSVLPPVTVGEAISIAKLTRVGGGGGGAEPSGRGWRVPEHSDGEVKTVRERLMAKFEMVRKAVLKEQKAAGYTIVDGVAIPPGWTWAGDGPPAVPDERRRADGAAAED